MSEGRRNFLLPSEKKASETKDGKATGGLGDASSPVKKEVRVKGLEPIRRRHQILSLACLPISTHPQDAVERGAQRLRDCKYSVFSIIPQR